MADIKDRVEAEYEAIENILSLIPDKTVSQLSQLELAGLKIYSNRYLNQNL